MMNQKQIKKVSSFEQVSLLWYRTEVYWYRMYGFQVEFDILQVSLWNQLSPFYRPFLAKLFAQWK
jgi:hypothetical protein